jgi:hypothetical protein
VSELTVVMDVRKKKKKKGGGGCFGWWKKVLEREVTSEGGCAGEKC